MNEAAKNRLVSIPDEQLDKFVRGYLVAALWSSYDPFAAEGFNDDKPLDEDHDVDDIDPKSLAGARSECRDFMQSNWQDLKQYAALRKHNGHDGTVWDHAGHDFWLTRCGHGCGFWDRGLGKLGDRLTQAAHVYGGQDMYIGDDGKVYIAGFEDFAGE